MYDGRVVFEIDAETKHFDNQIESVKNELEDLLNRYDETKAMKPFKGKEEDLKQLSVEIEKANNKLVNLQEQERNLQLESEKTGKNISKSFGDGLKNVKRLAMGIIGIRSVYMLARRAASAYMAEDTELTEKMNQAWINLGAFLEPFLSFVADAMLKLTGYLNEFIKALTGTDYLARANAKALAKQTKEQNKLNAAMDKYQQYDFDVIRTQSSTGGGASGGYGESGLGSAFGDMPELNQNLVKGIQNLAGALKSLYDLVTFKEMRDGIKELDEATRIEQDVTNNLVKVASNTAKIIKETPDVPKADLDASMLFKKQNEDYLRLIEDAQKSYDNLKYNFPILTAIGVVGERELNVQKNYRKSLQANIKALIEMAKQGRLTEDGYYSLLEMVTLYGDELEKTAGIEGENKFALQDVYDALGDYTRLYPNTISQILGFDKATKTQKEQIADLTDKFLNGKISIFEYTTEMNKIPKNVSTKIETPGLIDAGKNLASYVANAINKIPNEKTTKVNVDDKDAETKTKNYKNNLLNLPSTVLTTIKATLDTSAADWQMQQFKQKVTNFPIVGGVLNKLFSVIGFAGGGYISQPTLAMVGEGKYNEYVIPEGEDYISRLASEIGKYGGGGGTTNVYLDGRLIQRQVNKTANQVSFTRNGR